MIILLLNNATFYMAKDIFHDKVKAALIKDGWHITHDPLTVKLTKRNIFIDLGAEKVIAAERHGQKIAVEIKSFLGCFGQISILFFGFEEKTS
jgi:hypothetical protein